MYDPLGLSIGTTNLVAVRNGTPPVTRRTVPMGSPNAADSSRLVEALAALITETGGDPSTSNITIAVPAHWDPEAMQELQDALGAHAGFVRGGIAPCLVSDAVTALTALNSDARLPADGVVALLDFGGGGTSITLTDAASGFTPIADTLRYREFSGDLIDQALLVHVLGNVGHTKGADPDSTAAVGQLAQLREECRLAKERLSAETVTEIVAELPRQRARVKVTRAELESLIEDRLTGVLSAFDEVLRRNGVRGRDLAAVAMAGGCASIPLVAQRLSSHAQASVVTAVQPELAMAVGAVMLAARQPFDEQRDEAEAPTAMAAMVGASTGSFAASTGSFAAPTGTFDGPTGGFGVTTADAFFDEESSETQLAWSQADDSTNEPVFYTGEPYGNDVRATPSQLLPKIEPAPAEPKRRHRLPQLFFGVVALISMIAIGGVAFTLTSTTEHQAPPAPSSTAVPPPSLPSSQPPSPSPLPPPPSAAPSASIAPPPTSAAPAHPPPPPVTTTYEPPPTTTAQATTSTTTPPPTTTTTTTPSPSATTSTPTTTTTTVPMTTEYLRVPFMPVPIPVQVPGGQGGASPPQNPFLSPGG